MGVIFPLVALDKNFSAKNTFWHDNKSTSCGSLVLNRQLHILNGHSPTHYDERTESYSNRSVIMYISQKYFWVTHDDSCGSDYFLISIKELEYSPEIFQENELFKADWPLFTLKTSDISSYDSAKGVKENLTIYENNYIDSVEDSIPLCDGCKLHCPVPWWSMKRWEAKKAGSRLDYKFKTSRSDSDYLNYKK